MCVGCLYLSQSHSLSLEWFSEEKTQPTRMHLSVCTNFPATMVATLARLNKDRQILPTPLCQLVRQTYSCEWVVFICHKAIQRVGDDFQTNKDNPRACICLAIQASHFPATMVVTGESFLPNLIQYLSIVKSPHSQ